MDDEKDNGEKSIGERISDTVKGIVESTSDAAANVFKSEEPKPEPVEEAPEHVYVPEATDAVAVPAPLVPADNPVEPAPVVKKKRITKRASKPAAKAKQAAPVKKAPKTAKSTKKASKKKPAKKAAPKKAVKKTSKKTAKKASKKTAKKSKKRSRR